MASVRSEAPRRRTTFGAARLLRAAAFRASALGDLPPALDRRRIAAPRVRTRHRGEIRLAYRSMARHNLSEIDVSAGVSRREVSQKLSKCFRFASGSGPRRVKITRRTSGC